MLVIDRIAGCKTGLVLLPATRQIFHEEKETSGGAGFTRTKKNCTEVQIELPYQAISDAAA
jgi:hypothetical protein